MPGDYRYIQNLDCAYFPCHGLQEQNCKFCFCPLYQLIECGGTYTKTPNGVKDCSSCLLVHSGDSHEYVISKLQYGERFQEEV